MNHSTSSTDRRRRTTTVAAMLVVVAAIVAFAYPTLAASSSPSGAPPKTPPSAKAHLHHPSHALPKAHRVGVADGVVPDGVTIFDNDVPAVTRLDPALLSALRRAATDAGGITFYVNSGWRSKAYQEQLLREAISKYGSKAEAARWVATPDSSAHVSGNAVDLGRADATGWLSRHGAAYGLCQIYRNETWHYELRPQAVTSGCPAMYADPTHDPRMK